MEILSTAFPKIRTLCVVPENSFDALGVTDSGFSALANLINLRKLHVQCEGLTDVGLSSFHTLVKLESLELHFGDFTGTGFRNLSTLTVLHTLDISFSESHLTDDGVLECARAFQSLRCLIIGNECREADDEHNLTSAAWRHLSRWASPTLTSLDVSGIPLTDEDMNVLGRLKLHHLIT